MFTNKNICIYIYVTHKNAKICQKGGEKITKETMLYTYANYEHLLITTQNAIVQHFSLL